MQSVAKTKTRLFLFSGLAALSFFAAPSITQAAASLYVGPAAGSFVVGSTFTVSIYVNTGGQAINAIEADLRFPPDKLQVVSPTTGKSFIQVWVNQPSYSNQNGSLKFQGTVPTPGINSDAALLSTITFRVKSVGTASLEFLDSSSVFLNDGHGTDILGQITDGIYYLTLPPPGGPVVTSRTNPDQEKWYNSQSVVFEWTAPPDIEGYSYILDNNPISDIDDISEGVKTRVVYNNLADGVYYFHIKALRQKEWGGTTDYVARVDMTPPAKFDIHFSPGSRTTNKRPIIDFITTDAASGIDHYELKFIPLDLPLAMVDGSSPFFIEAIPPYSRKTFSEGRYDVIVRAYDKAANYYQAEGRLSIVRPLFEVVGGDGIKIGGDFTLAWPYVAIVAAGILAALMYASWFLLKRHREIEAYFERTILKHPHVAGKFAELQGKQKEYDSSRGSQGGAGGGKNLMIIAAIIAFGLGMCFSRLAFAENNPLDNVHLEPPIVTLFSKSLSNDEIFYIGGRSGAPQAKVLIYLQNLETGGTLNEVTVTDQSGAWFYSSPRFFDAGHYIIWTQLKIAGEASPPSAKLELSVQPTAIQFGNNRLSYEKLYFILLVIFALAFLGLLGFIVYHSYHVRAKNRKLHQAIKQAEESIHRGFSVIHHNIQTELGSIRDVKRSKELSAEEKLREEKLLRDLESVSRYIGKEVWEIEKAEHDLN